ncbi:UDP-glycosyltransferase 75C1-like [Impatiens glandulifera]|uniref:UDP-glycosyltransferase 75C1-like n=1 Tax=Impatiens glandulifera TaxID=253017 RepID=UPI001FB19015|nr:UDP-glycosyltransferase 75C1-like [Impatiens glandulifera]
MEKGGDERHILLVSFPGLGHINPTLEFAKRVVRLGVKVTFLTAKIALKSIPRSSPPLSGITFVGYSTDYGEGRKPVDDNVAHFMSEIQLRGSNKLSEMLSSSAASEEGGRQLPFSRLVYATLMPWAAEVARAHHVPATLLWLQPAAIFDIYHYYFNEGYDEEINQANNSSSWSIHLPGMPNLGRDDLPSFLVSKSKDFEYAIPLYKEHFTVLQSFDEGPPQDILVNTFESLEPDALKAIPQLNLIPIGPLVSLIQDNQNSSDYMEFLDSKPKGSVIYASFGSHTPLSVLQIHEIGQGLKTSGRPFLWVIRDTPNDESWVNYVGEMEKQGKIISWCSSQVDVLNHPSVGCFVSHCGWGSTLESLGCGVPMVCFPLWIDQMTNAKLVQDVWRIGVRVKKELQIEIVKGEEFKRCIEMVMMMGLEGEEMRKNAQNWKLLTQEAGKLGASSDLNLNVFINKL